MEFLHHAFDVIDDRTIDDDLSSRLFLVDFNREHLQFIFNEEESRPVHLELFDEPEASDDPVILSQQLSQLSTDNVDHGKRQHSPTTNSLEPVTKKTRTDLVKFEETFPHYLQQNDGQLHELQSLSNDRDVSFDDLQALAFFRHQIGIYQQHERLWLKFIRFGIGQLSDEDRLAVEQTPIIQTTTMTRIMYGPFWTAAVKQWLLLRPSVQILLNQGETDEQFLFEFAANERLQQARERLNHYEQEYQEKKAMCLPNNKTMEESIVEFVEHHGIQPFRLKTDLQANELHIEFRQNLLRLRFEQENPTDYQVKRNMFSYVK